MQSFIEELHNEHPTWNAYDLASSYNMANPGADEVEVIRVACSVLGITLKELRNGCY